MVILMRHRETFVQRGNPRSTVIVFPHASLSCFSQISNDCLTTRDEFCFSLYREKTEIMRGYASIVEIARTFR